MAESIKGRLCRLGEELVDALLKEGASEVIVIPAHTDKLMVRFSNNRVTVLQDWNVDGASVLAIFGRRRIVSHLEDVSKGAIKAWVEMASRQAKAMPETLDMPTLPKPIRFTDHPTEERIDAEVMAEGVRTAIDSAIAGGADRASGVFIATISRDALVGSNGSSGYDERPLFELNVRAFHGEGSGQGISCGTRMGELDPEAAGREAGRLAKLSETALKWQEGKYDVLLGPMIGANLMERVGNACSAFSVEAGVSSLAGKLGEKVFSEAITITDDGSSEGSPHARLFDDEGTPTRPTTLVERGVLKSYLHNSSTAKRFKVESTGNAGWISPSPWSLVVGEGAIGAEELVEELKEGAYIVSNWYTRFQNYLTGDFSTIARDGAFLVRDGEIAGAMRGVRISDNINRLFSAVEGVSSERRWIKWWEVRTPTLMPSILSRGVTLTRAQGS